MTQLSHTFEEPENGNVEYGHILKQSKGSAVIKDWILLNIQSTVDVFYNAQLLRNIRKFNRTLDIHCNAGVVSTDMVGDLPGYGTVWYHPTGTANILSLSRYIKIFTITYDSANGNEFCMHKGNGEDRLLRQSENGLYFWNARTFNQEEVVLINTVENNSSRYSNRELSQAKIARKLQRTIGRPSYKEYQKIVNNKRLNNCPLMVEDVKAAEHYFSR